jgi:hypothetical protein
VSPILYSLCLMCILNFFMFVFQRSLLLGQLSFIIHPPGISHDVVLRSTHFNIITSTLHPHFINLPRRNNSTCTHLMMLPRLLNVVIWSLNWFSYLCDRYPPQSHHYPNIASFFLILFFPASVIFTF